MDPYVGEVRLFPYNFAPRHWAFCHGQLLPISSHTALFSIIGNRYGGDGHTDFALPNLPGRVVIGTGAGPGLTPREEGERIGQNQVTLTEDTMSAHRHGLQTYQQFGTDVEPGPGKYLAQDRRGGGGVVRYIAEESPSGNAMHSEAVSATGGGQAHENQQPYLSLYYCIALKGEFPPHP